MGSTPTASCCTTTCCRMRPADRPPARRAPRDRPRPPPRRLLAVLPTAENSPTDASSRDHRIERQLVDGCLRREPALRTPASHEGHVAGIAMGLTVRATACRADRHSGSPRRQDSVAGTDRGSLRCRWTSRSRASPRKSWGRHRREGRIHPASRQRRCRTRAPRHAARAADDVQDQSEKIRDVIGKGGAVIRALTEERPARRSTSKRRHHHDRVGCGCNIAQS